MPLNADDERWGTPWKAQHGWRAVFINGGAETVDGGAELSTGMGWNGRTVGWMDGWAIPQNNKWIGIHGSNKGAAEKKSRWWLWRTINDKSVIILPYTDSAFSTYSYLCLCSAVLGQGILIYNLQHVNTVLSSLRSLGWSPSFGTFVFPPRRRRRVHPIHPSSRTY